MFLGFLVNLGVCVCVHFSSANCLAMVGRYAKWNLGKLVPSLRVVFC